MPAEEEMTEVMSAAEALEELLRRDPAADWVRLERCSQTLLREVSRAVGADVLRAAVRGLHQEDSPGSADRFCVGDCGMVEDDVTAPPTFYPADYLPAFTPAGLPAGVSLWGTVTGALWSADERADMVGTCRAVAERSRTCGSEAACVAVALYTQMVTRRVLWAKAVGGKWRVVPDRLLAALEADVRREGDRMITEESPHSPQSQRTGTGPLVLQRAHSVDDLHAGVYTSRAGSVPVLRFDNAHRGSPEHSPMHETVAWVLPPTSDGIPAAQAALPPAGVMETLQSTAVYGSLSAMPDGWPWRVGASLADAGGEIDRLCLAQPNQKSYSGAVHERWLAALRSANTAARVLSEAKIGDEARPAPHALLRAVELQWLQKGAGPRLHVALSGPGKAVWDGGCADSVFDVQRLDRPADEHPYWSLNHSMRSAHIGNTRVKLEIKGTDRLDGVYTAPCPPAWAPSDGAPSLTTAGGAVAVKVDGGWAVGGVHAAASACALDTGSLLLPQCVPLIYYLDAALAELRTSDAPVRMYRGLSNVKLDARMYSPGRVVLWSQFSSSSADMAIACGFTSKEQSAVFSVVGQAAVPLSRLSRFAREQEWLFPPSTLFLIENSLSEEAAEILGKQDRQLFELRVVHRRQAVALKVRRLMSNVRGAAASARVGGLFKVATLLDEGDEGAAAEALLSHDGGALLGPEVRQLLDPVCQLTGRRSATFLQSALAAAAAAGDGAAAEALVALGANVCSRTATGSTPLHLAAAANSVDCVKKLVTAGATLRTRDVDGHLACEVAAAEGAHDVVRWMGECSSLPPRLAVLYAPVGAARTTAHVACAVLLLALTIVAFELPVARSVVGDSRPAPDLGTYVGDGECIGEWGTQLQRHLQTVTAAGDCYLKLREPDVVGVWLERLTDSLQCSVFVNHLVAAAQPKGATAPLYGGPAAVNAVGPDGFRVGGCWRRADLPSRVAFSYTHVNLQGPGPGFAPEEPGVLCEALRVGGQGEWTCADNSSCGSEQCCSGRGGVRRCPRDKAVPCELECRAGGDGCCRNKGWRCEEKRMLHCRTGFVPCVARPYNVLYGDGAGEGDVCELLLDMHPDRGYCHIDLPVVLASNLRQHPGESLSRSCAQTCGCPGSAQAETLVGGETLLNDGSGGAPDGGGCVSLAGAVRLRLQQRHNLSAVQLQVFGRSAAVELSADGEVWADAAAVVAGGWLTVRTPFQQCVRELWLRTSARVCEVALAGVSCGDALSVSNWCYGPSAKALHSAQACSAAAAALQQDTIWDTDTDPYDPGCQTAIPAAQNSTRVVSVCYNRPLYADVEVVDGASDFCRDENGSTLPFVSVAGPRGSCLKEMMQHREVVMAVTILVTRLFHEVTQWCLLHIRPGGDLNTDALRYTSANPGPQVPTLSVMAHGRLVGEPLLIPGLPPGDFPGCQSSGVNASKATERLSACALLCDEVDGCAGVSGTLNDTCCFFRTATGIADADKSLWTSMLNVKRDIPVFVADANQTRCHRTAALPVPEDRPYRTSLSRSCPVGTTGDLSLDQCSQSARYLRLPHDGVAVDTARAPPGCTYSEAGLLWAEDGDTSLFQSKITLQVCMRLPAAVRELTLKAMTDSGSTGMRLSATLTFSLLCMSSTLAVTWIVAAMKAYAKDCMQCKAWLVRLPLTAAMPLVAGAGICVGAVALAFDWSRERCEAELRTTCEFEWMPGFYVLVSAACAAAVNSGLLQCRRSAAGAAVRTDPFRTPPVSHRGSTASVSPLQVW
eukprot:TRINITY_DN3600_c0_g3_i1.p1 TRINITY_DN3600_c0_g3~~TRINITY_DN3600_c0_g3_i1.p1  ORF type:complete len:1750 (+),score=618.30 TRINITY_DN3600_c0_g3_i1:69-5318(+)